MQINCTFTPREQHFLETYDYSKNVRFFIDAGNKESSNHWKKHTVQLDGNLLQELDREEPHASITSIQSIAKEIFTQNNIPTVEKIKVARGVCAIFEGHGWKLEGIDIPIKWIENGVTTEELLPLPLLLKSDMLLNEDMLEQNGNLEKPVIYAPRNVSVKDFHNFIEHYYNGRDGFSFSIEEWAGILSIFDYLKFNAKGYQIEHMISTGLFGRVGYVNSNVRTLKELDELFLAIHRTALGALAGEVLQFGLFNVMRSSSINLWGPDLKGLPHFALVQSFSFKYDLLRSSEEGDVLRELFPNIELPKNH